MSNGSTLKQFGRLKYVDPTNIFKNKNSYSLTYSRTI